MKHTKIWPYQLSKHISRDKVTELKISLNRNRIFIYIFYALFVLTAVYDTFVNLQTDYTDRSLAIYNQALILLIMVLYVLISLMDRNISHITFHYSLLLFMGVLSLYAVYSPNLDRLPVCILGISSFYIFYYVSYKNSINFKLMQQFAIVLLIIYSVQTYYGFVYRSTGWADYFIKADNTGYRAMYLMLLYALFLKNSKDLMIFSSAFLLVLFSLKRGAIIIGVIIYILGIWPFISNKIKMTKRRSRYIGIAASIIVMLIMWVVIANWDVLSYRFVSDTTSGSGRGLMYSSIYNGWRNGNIRNIVFGFGFYQVSAFMGSTYSGDALTYAHSDLQVLFDHGLLGALTYLMLYISFIKNRRVIKKYSENYYSVFFMIAFTWLLKSTYSGVYMNKDSIILFMVIGIILGKSTREKHKQNKLIINKMSKSI